MSNESINTVDSYFHHFLCQLLKFDKGMYNGSSYIMIWSKLKKEIKSRFSKAVKDEVDFFMTEYAGFYSGRAWITINGNEIVNFSTAKSYVHFGNPWNELTKDSRWSRHSKVADEERNGGLIEEGEFSRGDFTDSCYKYLTLSIQDAQKSEHPIIRLLAVLDKRTGKRKLKELEEVEVNPLVKYFLVYRMSK